MIEPEINSTQSLIDRYYQEEQQKRLQERTRADITLKIEPTDLAMLNMLARRFGKTRDEIAQDAFSHALKDMLARMESGERKLLARDADESARQLANSIAEENGIESFDISQSSWVAFEKTVTRAERKRQKDQDQLMERLAKAEKIATLAKQQLSSLSDEQDKTKTEAETGSVHSGDADSANEAAAVSSNVIAEAAEALPADVAETDNNSAEMAAESGASEDTDQDSETAIQS